INTLADKYDQTVSQLEQSIRGSARKNFWLSLAAAGLCVIGFGVHCLSGRLSEDAGPRNASMLVSPRGEPGQPTFSPRNSSPATSVVSTHDGSFPDAGYAR